MLNRLKIILEMIKFEHTIFALPFALMAAFLAAKGWPSISGFFWVTVAMIGARNAAMSFNRLVDLGFDAQNPRTKDRPLPAHKIKRKEVIIFLVLSSGLFFLAASALNKICLWLSPLVFFILLFYSYTKRFTCCSHLVLGLCLGLAPLGGWLAISGEFALLPIILGVGVLFWVAGFDIIYACLDYDFDRKAGLHSVPEKIGIRASLWVSIALHFLAAICFLVVGIMAGLGLIYLIGYAITLFSLVYQHLIVSPEDLSRVNLSFFVANGFISLLLCGSAIVDIIRMGQ